MNKKLKQFAKKYIIENLSECLPEQVDKFKRIYSHENLNLNIENVVEKIPDEKLDWAMTQVENTIKLNKDNYAVHQTGRS